MKQQERRRATLMEISSKYNIYLKQDFHILKTTDFQSYFFKMKNEIPKTPKVKKAGIGRNKVVDNMVYSFENLIKTFRLPSLYEPTSLIQPNRKIICNCDLVICFVVFCFSFFL